MADHMLWEGAIAQMNGRGNTLCAVGLRFSPWHLKLIKHNKTKQYQLADDGKDFCLTPETGNMRLVQELPVFLASLVE